MNLIHRWYCASGRWSRMVRNDLLPWAMFDLDLGDAVLELGPGPGLTTRELASLLANLTAVEIDPVSAQQLRAGLDATNVDVVTADATDLPFGPNRFSAVVAFTMLHHVPTPDLQDRLLVEAHRVLRPGGVFAGSDSTTGPLFRLAHAFDTMVLVDPDTFGDRLLRAGFVDPQVGRARHAFRFRATKPLASS